MLAYTEDVLAGRLGDAIAKCAREWASLPGSPYGQPTRTMAQARATYEQFGGAYEPASEPIVTELHPTPAPATPEPPMPAGEALDWPVPRTEEKDMPAPGLLGALAGVAIDLFSPLARKEIGRHTGNAATTDQLTTTVIEALKKATGQTDPVAAVADSCVGCGLCGEVAHAAVLCPSFYRAEIINNPSAWDRFKQGLRQRVIGWLQNRIERRLEGISA
jgi:NAD-dependent dihydropyrimidine dehydrogenase PreA subunit